MKHMMLAATVASGLGGAALADTPLTQLMAQETGALRAISGDRLARYVTRPEVGVAYTRDWVTRQTIDGGNAQSACLTEALYFEARGESVKGQFAVAEVIMNRVDSAEFPDTICDVIHQGTGRKFQCQFTYTCDGKPEHVADQATFARVGKVARLMAQGAPRRLTDGATFYHSRAVSPRWSRVFERTASIGVHHFYRKPTQLSRN